MHDCVQLLAAINESHVELTLRGPLWATVKLLNTLTYARSAARSAESVSLLSFCTYFFAKEKFNEYHGLIKFYIVGKLG
jgi:hypothetical protein